MSNIDDADRLLSQGNARVPVGVKYPTLFDFAFFFDVHAT